MNKKRSCFEIICLHSEQLPGPSGWISWCMFAKPLKGQCTTSKNSLPYRMSHQYWANFDRSNGVVRIGRFWWNLDIIYLNCMESLSFWFHTETLKIVNFFILANFLWSFLPRSKLMPFQILPLAFSSKIFYHLLPISIMEVQNSLPLAFSIDKCTFVESDKFSPTFFKMLVEISISIENKIVKEWIIDLHFFSLEFQCH